MTRNSVLKALSIAAVGALLSASGSRAEVEANYPSKIIKIVVPFSAGGTADAVPRVVAEKLRQKWGQAVIIENRAGAGGNIGAEFLANSQPDGYTLLASPPGPIAINETLYKKLSFKPSDFLPVTLLATAPNVVDVRANFPVKSIGELIAFAKANPEKVTFASQGNGSTSHLTAMLFQSLTQTRMTHVAYKGTAPALQDIVGGSVDVFFDNLGSSLNLHESGRLRILAVCGPERTPPLADIPTVQEAGVAGFTSVTWFALMAPKGTPSAIVDKLNQAVTEILREPDVQSKLTALGVQASPMTVNSTAQFIDAERSRWGDIIRSTQTSVD
jgi:tripartite-type tricarboxylate transporter receptor subunit TctC